jgi:hypothetical protein
MSDEVNQSTAGLPPNFRINLTGVRKGPGAPGGDNEAADGLAGMPQLPELMGGGGGLTVQPLRRAAPEPVASMRGGTTLARKNLVVQSDSDDSDFGAELQSIPVGKDLPVEPVADGPELVEAPVIQMSQLPELNVDDDEDFRLQGDRSKLSILQDLLLTQDIVEEGTDEWNYRTFIKQFANSEAAQENADNEDGYDAESDSEEDYDD